MGLMAGSAELKAVRAAKVDVGLASEFPADPVALESGWSIKSRHGSHLLAHTRLGIPEFDGALADPRDPVPTAHGVVLVARAYIKTPSLLSVHPLHPEIGIVGWTIRFPDENVGGTGGRAAHPWSWA